MFADVSDVFAYVCGLGAVSYAVLVAAAAVDAFRTLPLRQVSSLSPCFKSLSGSSSAPLAVHGASSSQRPQAQPLRQFCCSQPASIRTRPPSSTSSR
jgi:hypothetical protein